MCAIVGAFQAILGSSQLELFALCLNNNNPSSTRSSLLSGAPWEPMGDPSATQLPGWRISKLSSLFVCTDIQFAKDDDASDARARINTW